MTITRDIKPLPLPRWLIAGEVRFWLDEDGDPGKAHVREADGDADLVIPTMTLDSLVSPRVI